MSLAQRRRLRRLSLRLFILLRRRRTLNVQYSIENIQLLQVTENIPIQFD